MVKINQKVGQADEIYRETFLGNDERKEFLHQYLGKIYLSMINNESQSNSDNTDAYFSYFSFLSEIVQNQNTLFLEIQKYRSAQRNKNMNIIQKARLELQIDMVYKKYSNIIQSQQSSISDVVNSIYSIITYDEKLNAAEKMFFVCISKKKQLLIRLCESEFHLNDLQLQMQDLYDSREHLNILLESLVEYKCYSTYLRCLCESFQLTFKFDSKLLQFIRKTKKMSSYITKIPLYSEDSCAAFISLLSNTIGQIISVSKNFFEVTKIYTNDQSIGKNIDFLIPKDLAKSHQLLMQGFLKQEKIDLSIISKPLLLGQDKDGWAIPYQMKFQLSFVDQTNDIGLACWIRRLKDERLHVLTDLNKSLTTITISKKLHSQIFAERYPSGNVKKIHLAKWIPILSGWENILQKRKNQFQNPTLMDTLLKNKKHLNQQHIDIQLETLMLKPYKTILPVQINPQTIMEDLLGVDLYKISIQLSFVQNLYMQFLVISFSLIEPLNDLKLKQDYITDLKQQIEDYSIDFSNIYDGIDKQSTNHNTSIKKYQTKIDGSHHRDKSRLFDNSTVKNNTTFEDKTEEIDIYKQSDFGDQKNWIVSDRQMNSSRNFILGGNYQNQGISNQPTYTHLQLGVPQDESFSYQNLVIAGGNLTQLVNSYQQWQNQQNDEIDSPIKKQFDNEKFSVQDYPVATSQQNNLIKQISTNVSTAGINNQIINLLESNDYMNQNNYNYNSKSFASNFKTNYENKEQNLNAKKIKQSDNQSKSSQGEQIQSDFNSDSISDRQQKTINKQTSVSGVSSINSERQVIARFISKKNGLSGIQLINILGGLALLVIGIFTLIAFLSMNDRLEIDKQNFILLNWMSGINSVLSVSNTDLAALELIKLGFYEFNQESEKQFLVNKLQKELIYMNNIMQNRMDGLYHTDSLDQIVFQNVIGNPAEQVIFSGRDETITKVNSSFVYELITQTAYVALQNNLLDEQKTFQHNSELNFQPLNSLIFNVTTKINLEFQQRQDDQRTAIINRSIIFACISFAFALSVIPTYRFIMNKQSEILRLFATIEPEKINIMVQNLKHSQTILNFSNSRSQLLKHNKMTSLASIRSFNNQVNQIVKKKNINNTIPMQMAYAKIIVIVLTFFIGLQIQPITDFVISSKFFNNCQDRYKLFMAVMDTQSITNELIQGRQNIILSRLYPQKAVLDYKYYLEFMKWRNIWSQENLQRFQDIQNTKDINSKYQQDKMNNFFFKALEVNVCDTFIEFPYYFGDVNFIYDLCKSTSNGILLKGLQIAIKSFIQSCNNFYEICQEEDDNIFKQKSLAFYKGASVTDRFNFKQQLKESLDILLNFLKDVNTSQYNQQISTQKIFIIWQLLTILIVFFFGLLKYSIYVEKKIQQTKEYLNLIEISVLENNPYIHSFLKQNS